MASATRDDNGEDAAATSFAKLNLSSSKAAEEITNQSKESQHSSPPSSYLAAQTGTTCGTKPTLRRKRSDAISSPSLSLNKRPSLAVLTRDLGNQQVGLNGSTAIQKPPGDECASSDEPPLAPTSSTGGDKGKADEQ